MKILKRTSQFIFLIIISDLILGQIAGVIYFSQKTGKYARLTETIKETEAPILIMGSSHAYRHFNPDIISKNLNKDVYNAGVQGKRLHFQATLGSIVLKRYTPSYIVLNVDPYWLTEAEDTEAISELDPYYWQNKEIIDQTTDDSEFIHTIKMLSSAYRYNSTLIHIIKYYFLPQKSQKGYQALKGTLNEELLYQSEGDKKLGNRTPLESSLNTLTNFIKTSKEKGSQVIITISPTFKAIYSKNDSEMVALKEISHSEDIPLFDLSNNEQFSGNNELFYDPTHLNSRGADLFSTMISDSLKRTFQFD